MITALLKTCLFIVANTSTVGIKISHFIIECNGKDLISGCCEIFYKLQIDHHFAPLLRWRDLEMMQFTNLKFIAVV